MEALVLGGAEGVFDDLEAASPYLDDPIVIAANDVGTRYQGHLHHWVSLHPSKLEAWKNQRRKAGYNMDFTTWAHRKCQWADKILTCWGGSSGMLAVQVARELGCTKIVLCGVPMDPRGHFFKKDEWTDCHAYRRAWNRKYDDLAPYVRSMSGWTRELFGPPTE